MANINLESIAKSAYALNKTDITYLEKLLLDEKRQLIVLPYKDLKDIPQNDLSVFCVKHGFYSIPTQEMIDFLEEEIGDQKEKTIEIGAGNGVYCRNLEIRGTDNFMQDAPHIKTYYDSLGQATVPYDKDYVERLEALEAVKKYRPTIVLASWVTHKYSAQQHWRGGNEFGIKEGNILSRVKKYIHIGHENVHRQKPILNKPHRTIKEPWIVSRSLHGGNVVYIWES